MYGMAERAIHFPVPLLTVYVNVVLDHVLHLLDDWLNGIYMGLRKTDLYSIHM